MLFSLALVVCGREAILGLHDTPHTCCVLAKVIAMCCTLDLVHLPIGVLTIWVRLGSGYQQCADEGAICFLCDPNFV